MGGRLLGWVGRLVVGCVGVLVGWWWLGWVWLLAGVSIGWRLVVVVRAVVPLLLWRWRLLRLRRVGGRLAEVRVGCVRCVGRVRRVWCVWCVWLWLWLVVCVGWWWPVVVWLLHGWLGVGCGGA